MSGGPTRSDNATIYVGVLLFTVELPGLRSLKEKRSVVVPLVERMQARFHLSVARIAGADAHDWERLGAAVLGSDRLVVLGSLQAAEAFLLSSGVTVSGLEMEIERW